MPALTPSGAAAERLSRVADGRGVVITTGQQPGLFGGPMYTWSKAVSAIAFADVLERSTGIPVAPVFWAATYDADFAEASASYVALGATVERLQIAPPAEPGRSMRETPLGNVESLVRVLEQAMGSAADPAVLDLVRTTYRAGETVGSAFVALARALLEPLGMVVLDAGHEVVRAAEASLVRRALVESAAVDAALQAREDELRRAGYEPTVAHVKGLSLVFEAGAGERSRIPIARAAAAADDDERIDLEPNVLLRPVAERTILPTASYVAGPSEIAYFAQSSAVASVLDVPMPLVLPRWSGVIVEPHVQRILDRYALGLQDLRDPHAALGRLARARIPAQVRDALARYRAAMNEAAAEFARAVASTEPPLLPGEVGEGARRSIQHRLDRLERRVVAASKRREEELVHDLETARAALFPLGKPQERVLNLMPMLARHGTSLLDAMRGRAEEHAEAIIAPELLTEPVAAHDHAGDHG
jgi:bacillithiol biosynthesis cysteine-adding enzyme BshC